MIPTPDEINKQKGPSDLVDRISNDGVLLALSIISLGLIIWCTSLLSSIKTLERKLDDYEIQAIELSQKIKSTESKIEKLNTLNLRVDTLAQCINDYMDTVGQSGGYSYRYYYCY